MRQNINVKFERLCVKNKKNGQVLSCPFVKCWLLIYYIVYLLWRRLQVILLDILEVAVSADLQLYGCVLVTNDHTVRVSLDSRCGARV